MFNLFNGKAGVVHNYNKDNEWLDACLGPLPPGADVYKVIDL